MMNTKLELMYRDGADWKNTIDVVLAGEITESDVKVINNNLISDGFFIAHQVGLPTASNLGNRFVTPDLEHDHVFTTMCDFEDGLPKPEDLLTYESADNSMPTVRQLVEKFKQVRGNWDEMSEMRRIGLTYSFSEHLH